MLTQKGKSPKPGGGSRQEAGRAASPTALWIQPQARRLGDLPPNLSLPSSSRISCGPSEAIPEAPRGRPIKCVGKIISLWPCGWNSSFRARLSASPPPRVLRIKAKRLAESPRPHLGGRARRGRLSAPFSHQQGPPPASSALKFWQRDPKVPPSRVPESYQPFPLPQGLPCQAPDDLGHDI